MIALTSMYKQPFAAKQPSIANKVLLRKLSLDSNRARNSLKIIKGKSEWWEGLLWGDENIQHMFTPYFIIYMVEEMRGW